MVSLCRMHMPIALRDKYLRGVSHQENILYKLPIVTNPRKKFKVLSSYAHSMCFENKISYEFYRKFLRLIAATYLQQEIEDKIDESVSLWSKRFSDWFGPHWEKSF